MPFVPKDARIPTELRTDTFFLRPLRASDVELDYDAVMASQESLRRRTAGRWPRAGFSIEENLADLQEHEEDFHARRGFTYTVLDPSETRCLGCVYVYPLADDDGDRDVHDREAVTRFWVRPDGVAADLERQVLMALVPWLRADFPFARLLFRIWSTDPRQMAYAREAGLRLVEKCPLDRVETLLFE